MISVKGTYRGGVITPAEPVAQALEGREVIITFLDVAPSANSPSGGNGSGARPLSEEGGPSAIETERPEATPEELDASWDSFFALIERCQVSTGIGDLAHQHDHYLYGTPKKPE